MDFKVADDDHGHANASPGSHGNLAKIRATNQISDSRSISRQAGAN